MKFSLNDYQGKNRLLLIFAPTPENSAYQMQMQFLQAQQAGCAERDLLLVELLAGGKSRLDGQTIDEVDLDATCSRFHVDPLQFQVILVGKDGTEKYRDHRPLPADTLFSQIDSMPMRQREMLEQQQ